MRFYSWIDIEQTIENIIYRLSMMQILVEPSKTSEDILLKITGELIGKYEVHDITNIFQFVEDTSQVLHEMKLYNNTIEQLFNEGSHYLSQLLALYHAQIFKIFDFFLKAIQKLYSRTHVQTSSVPQSILCSNCDHFVHQRNIKNVQRQILDYQKYSAQMLDNEFRCELEAENGEDREEERTMFSQSYFRRKLFAIQKNIEERQNNLIECIDDFETIRTNLLMEMNRRDVVDELKAFNLREYMFGITEHFLKTLRKIEGKISHIRKQNKCSQDQGTQVNTEPVEVIMMATQRSEHPKPTIKHDLQVKKLSALCTKLEESGRKYEHEIRECNSKIESLQTQNKRMREQLFVQKMKSTYKQKTTKVVEKLEERNRREEDDKHKRTSFLESFQSLLSDTGQLANQFSTSLKENFNAKDLANRQQEAIPIIKAVFKKALERFTAQKTLMQVNLEKRKLLKSQTVETAGNDRRRSRKKSLRMQLEMQGGRQSSRFSMRRLQKKQLSISQVFSLKMMGNDKYPGSSSSISQQGQSHFKKASQKDMGLSMSDGLKRKRLAKLSIFSDLKQHDYIKPDTRLQHHRQSTQISPELENDQLLSSNILSSNHVKKSAFRRNKSQEQLKAIPKIEDSFRISELKGKGFNLKAVQSFLFMNLNDQGRERESKMSLGERSRHMLEDPGEGKIQRQKIILSLQELSYLTSLFSLFAKVHLINAPAWQQIKEWVLSASPRLKNSEENSQSLIMRKVVSEIIFKHRQCSNDPMLCVHLTDFLLSIEQFLGDAELQAVERAKTNLIE